MANQGTPAKDVPTKPRALELVEAVAEGAVVISPNDAVEVRQADTAGMFEVKGLRDNPKSKDDTITFLSNHRQADLEQYEVAKSREDLERIREAHRLRDEELRKSLGHRQGTEAQKKGGESGKEPKVTYPELPAEVEGFPEENKYVKTDTYEVGNDYSIRVKRNKEGVEVFTPLFKGEAIPLKGKAEQVVRKKFPYHASRKRRGFDLTYEAGVVTAKPNGESTEKKAAAPKKKKEVVIPEGFALVEGASLKEGYEVHDIGGNAASGVPQDKDVVETITGIDPAPPTHGREYVNLHLLRVDTKEERTKYLSKTKKVVARKVTKKKK